MSTVRTIIGIIDSLQQSWELTSSASDVKQSSKLILFPPAAEGQSAVTDVYSLELHTLSASCANRADELPRLLEGSPSSLDLQQGGDVQARWDEIRRKPEVNAMRKDLAKIVVRLEAWLVQVLR